MPLAPREGSFHPVLTRLSIVLVALAVILGIGGVAIASSNAALAQQPASAAPAAPLSPVSLVDFTAFNRAVNTQLQTAIHVQEAKVQLVRAEVVSFAKAQIGDRYVAGAAGPNRFDCSGLTKYVFEKVVGKSLPHQSHAQYATVKKISFKDARPGDLVFFFRNGAHHVGIYIGGKKMVDAAGYGSGVRISPITGSWWSATYSGMGRILPA